jgi:hypothetical protein
VVSDDFPQALNAVVGERHHVIVGLPIDPD